MKTVAFAVRPALAVADDAPRAADSDADSDEPTVEVLPCDVVELNAEATSLEYIGTMGKKLTRIEGLDATPMLESLCFRSNALRTMSGVGHLTRLMNLELYENKVRRRRDRQMDADFAARLNDER